MAKIEKITTTKLELSAYEVTLLQIALSYASENDAYATEERCDEAATLSRELNG